MAKHRGNPIFTDATFTGGASDWREWLVLSPNACMGHTSNYVVRSVVGPKHRADT